MFNWLRRRQPSKGGSDLPRVDRDVVRHLFVERYGLPQVDWGMADHWVAQQPSDPDIRPRLKRAVVAAWLEEMRDALDADHQAWRRHDVEALTPLENAAGKRIAEASASAGAEIARALVPIRGRDPIDPYAIVALKPLEAYISFKAHFLHDDANVATSGGFYMQGSESEFPVIALSAAMPHALETILAHEVTHHALVDAGLPLWAEEGITQMMEERVAGGAPFNITSEQAARQRSRWAEDQLVEYVDGDMFKSPDDDDQELAYQLSQWVVRMALERDAKKFFEFLRACRSADPEHASQAVLGRSQVEFVRTICGIP